MDFMNSGPFMWSYRRLVHIGCVLLLSLMVWFCYCEIKSIKDLSHVEMVNHIDHITQYEAEAKEYVLLIHNRYHLDYDALVEVLRRQEEELDKTQERINNLLSYKPIFMYDSKFEYGKLDNSLKNIQESYVEYRKMHHDNVMRYEVFKSTNSVMYNSLLYLPTLVEEANELFIRLHIVHKKQFVDQLYQQILLLSLHGVQEVDICESRYEEAREVLKQIIIQLPSYGGTEKDQQTIIGLLRHASVVLEKRTELRQALKELLSLDHKERLKLLREAVLVHMNLFQTYQLRLELVTIAVASLLLIYVTALLLALWRMIQQLNATNLMLEKANRSKNDFLATMSHEMRTPLNGVLGMTQLLEHSSLDTEQKHWVQILRASGESMLQLVDDLLDLARIESHQMTVGSEPFQWRDALRDIVNIMTIKAADKSLSFEVNHADDVPCYILGDKDRIKQLLMQILSNAIKFTERGGVTMDVGFQVLDERYGRLHIVIGDTGIGIGKSQLNSIFKIFTQGEGGDRRRFGGLGIGLNIAKEIAHLMQGDIRIESELGKGTQCYITLEVGYLADAY